MRARPVILALLLSLPALARAEEPAPGPGAASPPASIGIGGPGEPAAPMKPAPGVARGSIDPEAVRTVVRAHVDEVRSCYERYLGEHPGAAGKATVHWTIQPDGSVTDARALEKDTTFPGVEVASCIVGRVSTWRFPSLEGGGLAVITYPWILRPPAQPEPAPR